VADPPSLVVFDCDGVLVDSEPISLRLLLETLAAAGVVLTPAEADELFLGR
jgi:beta-phosphoglucomutase-like phosphatase (HAD superfamily)